MQEIDKLNLNLLLNEIKTSIVHLQDKIESMSTNNKQNIDIISFKEEILKEISSIQTELDKNPKVLLTELGSLQNNLNNIQKTLTEKVYPTLSRQPSAADLSYLFSDVNKSLSNINKK